MQVVFEEVHKSYKIQEGEFFFGNMKSTSEGVIISGIKNVIASKDAVSKQIVIEIKKNIEIQLLPDYKKLEKNSSDFYEVIPYIKVSIFDIENEEIYVESSDHADYGYIKPKLWWLSCGFYCVDLVLHNREPDLLKMGSLVYTDF